MPKMSWDAFVTKHPGKGHLVCVGTQPSQFKKPPGISQKNQRQWPTVAALVREALGQSFSGDWAHRTEKVPGYVLRNGKRVKVASAALHHFVFSDPHDAAAAASYLRAPSRTAAPSPMPGFLSLIKGMEMDMSEYARLVKALGY